MRAVVQRVSAASVTDRATGAREAIERGLLVLLGVARGDDLATARRLAEKTAAMRVFADEAGKMNLSVTDVEGGVLVVPNFTVCGDTRKGTRPSYDKAAPPETADALYESFADRLREGGLRVGTGFFGAMMDVELVNDGPVTVIVELAPKGAAAS